MVTCHGRREQAVTAVTLATEKNDEETARKVLGHNHNFWSFPNEWPTFGPLVVLPAAPDSLT
jgi:hypothetical protein